MKGDEVRAMVLDAYFDEHTDSERFTSQDVCDNLRDTIALSPQEVTVYLAEHGWGLERQDDRLVWVSRCKALRRD